MWYEQHGLLADAIRHALAAKNFERAAGLIELAWPAMDGRFQAAAWLGWAKAIPDAMVRARPVLSVAYAWALLNGGELESAEARLWDAEQWLGISNRPQADSGQIAAEMVIVDEAQFRSLPASIATAHAYLAQAHGDLPGSVAYGRQALDLLPEADHLRRGPAAALLGLAQWAQGDLEVAYRTLADAMAGFQQVGNLHFAISVTSGLVDIRTVQGRLRDAQRISTQTVHLALDQGEPLLRGTADLYLGVCELHREQGDLAAAMHALLRSEELGEPAALPDWRYRRCRVRARLQETQGDLASALDLLDQADRHYYRTPLPDLRPLWAAKTRVWVAQGRLGDAHRSVREQGLTIDDQLSFLREYEHITLARVLLAEALLAPADHAMHPVVQFLDRLQHAAEAGGRMGSVIEIGVVQALAHQAHGQHAAALVALERALRLAEPEGYVRMFVDEGPRMAALLTRMKDESGKMKEYVARLLSAFGIQKDVQPSALSPQPLVEPLSQRELDVLRLVSQGCSNREISQRLVLALDTVKGHNRRIYEKLQVQRRTEAVARARELGLL
jgi:LuxR family maltose regulon positive regulatory protein